MRETLTVLTMRGTSQLLSIKHKPLFPAFLQVLLLDHLQRSAFKRLVNAAMLTISTSALNSDIPDLLRCLRKGEEWFVLGS
jgi:hypothetical protein